MTKTFDLAEAIAVLDRTPGALSAMLRGLPDGWTTATEGGETWSPYDVVGHLVHGERTDWIPRTRIILGEAADKRFTPYDRFAQFTESKGKTLGELLETFATLRAENLRALRGLGITESALSRTGIHPEFGAVTLRQLLATWVSHDLGHVVQVARTMARQYRDEAGPWRAYLSVIRD